MFSCASKKGFLSKGSQQAGKKDKTHATEAMFTEGMKYYLLESFSDAQSWFEKSLSTNQDLAASNYMLALIHYQQNKNAEALNFANKALKLNDKNKYYYELTAEIYEKMQNFSEASKVYKKMVTEVPGTNEFYYNLAATYVFQNEFEEALKTYAKIETLFGKSVELTRQKQQILLKVNKLDQAIAEGEAYLKEFPEEVDFQLVQAEILFSNNRAKEAIQYMEGIIKNHPNNGQARLLIFDMYKSQGMKEKANEQLDIVFGHPEVDLSSKIAILEDINRQTQNEESKKNSLKYAELLVKNYPAEANAHIAAGDVFFVQNKKEESWKSYLKAKSIDPSNFNLWNKIIILDSELNNVDSMVVHSEQALESFPNQAVLWLYNGSAYLMKKESKKAVESLEEGKKLSVNNTTLLNEFNIRLGDSYNELKEYSKSDAAYQEALKFDKNNAHVLNNYSYFLSLRKEKLEDAKEMSGKLVKEFPDSPTYLDTHAWVLYMMKDYEGAKKYLEKAIQNSKNGTIVEHYGDVLFQLGEKEKALEQWKKAKSLGETSDLIDNKINDKNLYE